MIGRLTKVLRAMDVDFQTIETAFDIGSRDGRQAVELANSFPNARVVAIECNPETLEECRRTCAQNARVTLVDKAVNSYAGRCTFYAIDTKRTVTDWKDGNPGASSLFLATGDYPFETFVQHEIEVECTRLDDLCRELRIDAIDLIWMDLQGAELIALESTGSLLDRVRFIYTEVSHRPIYHGQCLFDELEAFMIARGFKRITVIDRSRWQQDVIYQNTGTLAHAMKPIKSGQERAATLSIRSLQRYVSQRTKALGRWLGRLDAR